MTGRQHNHWWARAAAVGGVGALLMTYGCGGQTAGTVRAQEAVAGQPSAPVVVTCEPNQRTLVRPTIVNGAAVSQVECVSIAPLGYAQNTLAPAEAVYTPRVVQTALDAPLADARVIPASYSTPAVARPVRTRQVVYDERPVRVEKRRSVKKSAIIIGSSAGVGAGVGAAVGGKKGALIGAVLGGGGATLWDQITRRR